MPELRHLLSLRPITFSGKNSGYNLNIEIKTNAGFCGLLLYWLLECGWYLFNQPFRFAISANIPLSDISMAGGEIQEEIARASTLC
jgi:hypothetical protein